MKSHRSITTAPSRIPARLVASLSIALLATSVNAQTFVSTTGTTSWNSAGNWSPSGFPNAVGASATFNSPTGTQTVNLGAAITVGTINFTNNASTQIITLANGTGGSLVLDATGSGEAAINVTGTNVTTNNVTISASTTLNDTLRFTNNNVSGTGAGTATMTGTVSGSGGFIKDGPGRFSFTSVAKTYTGATVVEEGRLRFTATGAATGTSSITVQSGGMLMLDSNSGAFSFGTAPITINGAGTAESSQGAGAIRNNGTGANTLSNSVALGSNATIHVEGSSASFQLNGALSGGFTLTKVGAGNLILNNANTGITTSHTVTNGTVSVTSASKLGTGALSFAQSTTNNTTVTLNNTTQQIGTLSTTWTDTTGTQSQTLNLNGTALTVNQTSNATFGNGAVSTLTGVIAGTGSLTKSGAAALTLTGVNTYSGNTTIDNGTLIIAGSGSINGTSGITVNSGGVLRYNSTTALTKGVTVNGGTITGIGGLNIAVSLDSLNDVLSPGNSPGIQNFGVAQSWASFTYDWEINDWAAATAGTNFDQITITGSLTLTGTAPEVYELNVLSLLGDNSSGAVSNFTESSISRTVLTASGGITGFNASTWKIDATGFANAEMGTFSLDQSGNDLVLTYTPIPEPSTYAAMAGLGMIGFAVYRRRKHTAKRAA